MLKNTWMLLHMLNVVSFNTSQNPFVLFRYSRITDPVILLFEKEQSKMF